uniref:Pyrin domain-containing protein n=1 Tax=Hucho hucho TaxID=62062 RepID=A0A4W5QJA5_9TELE
MEGEGEVLYRTVHWDRRLLAQSGKRPAGPLFNIDCPQKSVCQLYLPHCQIHSLTPPGGSTAGTKNVHFLLLDILEELGQGDLKKFQWYINKGVEEFPAISEGQLEDADRLVTVDRMVQSYCYEGAVKITLEILRKMGRNNLADELMEKLTKQV